jgi:hypothetical protein
MYRARRVARGLNDGFTTSLVPIQNSEFSGTAHRALERVCYLTLLYTLHSRDPLALARKGKVLGNSHQTLCLEAFYLALSDTTLQTPQAGQRVGTECR